MPASKVKDQSLMAAMDKWNNQACGESAGEKFEPGSQEFFESVRFSRYNETDTYLNNSIPWDSAANLDLLEVGPGIGTDLTRWGNAGANVTGLEPTERHRELSRKNLKFQGLHGEVVDGDAKVMPFPDASFDVVYSHGVFHHIENVDQAVAEVNRVLRPDGRFIMSVYRFWSGFHLINLLLMETLLHGGFKKYGYKGVVSRIEEGADGIVIKPFIHLYTRRYLKRVLKEFKIEKIRVAHFSSNHICIPFQFPRWLNRILTPFLGWYFIVVAKKVE